MEFALTVKGPEQDVLDTVRDCARWVDWVPGLSASERVRGAVELRFAGPRPFQVVIEVTPLPDGVRWAMREGDLQGCRGEARIVEGTLCIGMELEFPIVVPGTLWQALELEWLPAVARGAIRAVREGSDRSGG